MNEKKIVIKPIPLLFFLLAAGVSAAFVYYAQKIEYIPHKLLVTFLGIIAALNFICLLLTIFMKKKWLQVILSLLIILAMTPLAGLAYFINSITGSVESIFSAVPETTQENIVLYDRITDSSADSISEGSYDYAVLNNDNFHDMKAAVNEVNAQAAKTSVSWYKDIYRITEALNTRDVHQRFYKNTVLIGEDYMEMLGDVWRTDYLMSELKPVYTISREVSTGLNHEEKPDVFTQPFTVLIGGNETRGSRSDADFLGRSDLSILLAVDPVKQKIGIIMIPRDIYINYNGEANHKDRLTNTSLHGIDVWQNSVSDLLDCRIDYYVRFNYSSLVKLIDALGGIEIDNSYGFQTFRDVKVGDEYISPQHYFDAGKLTLDGPYTLLFNRELMHLTGLYTDQMDNTIKVGEAIIDAAENLIPDNIKELNKGTFENIVNAINSLDKAVATDLDVKTIFKEYLNRFISGNIGHWDFVYYLPDCYYSYDTCYSANNYALLVGKITSGTLEISKNIIKSVLGE